MRTAAWSEARPVLVAGGAGGLGAAVVAGLARADRRAIVLDGEPPAGGDDHECVDFADTAATEDATVRLIARHEPIAAVVIAAGPGPGRGGRPDAPRVAWEHEIGRQLLGTAAVIRAALPFLIESRGRLVTVAAAHGGGDATARAASAFGLVGLVRALAGDLAGRVGITLLVPGGLPAPFLDPHRGDGAPPASRWHAPPERAAAMIISLLDRPDDCMLREIRLGSPVD